MKSIYKITILMILSLIVLTACQTKTTITEPALPNPEVSVRTHTPGQGQQYPIMAGQNINVGSMWVHNDLSNLYITYSLTNNWLLKHTHMHIASSLARIPKNRAGVPVPGQFTYSTPHNPNIPLYTYTIPFAQLGFQIGDNLAIAAHAEVVRNASSSAGMVGETAWGGNITGPGPRWWFYLEYTLINPPNNDDPRDFRTETAMLRMNDLPDDFSNRWGNHPWFSYVNHRPSENEETFYFYAGQHYRVGTAKISKDAGFMYVKIELDGNYQMTESHLNVSLDPYSGTPAFGLFPYKASHSPRVSTYQYKVAWKPMWDNVDLNIALHGVVGPF
jgi:hypothetical protein